MVGSMAAEVILFVVFMTGSMVGSVSAVVWRYQRLRDAGYEPLRVMTEESEAKHK